MVNDRRKIGFYSIRLINRSDSEEVLEASKLREVIDYIDTLSKKDKKLEIKSTNKFYFLSELENHEGIQTLIFKFAEHGYRPSLIDKDTLEERENPKGRNEGEGEKVHVALKYADNEEEIILIMEEKRSTIPISRLVSYLEEFADRFYRDSSARRPYKIEYGFIPKEGFLEELSNLQRVHVGYIHMTKKILGHELLNFSDRIEEVREDVVLEIKANKKQSIKDLARQVYNVFAASDEQIRKLRVYGCTPEGNEVSLDTEVMKKIQHLSVEINEDSGEVNSQDVLGRLVLILLEL